MDNKALADEWASDAGQWGVRTVEEIMACHGKLSVTKTNEKTSTGNKNSKQLVKGNGKVLPFLPQEEKETLNTEDIIEKAA